VCVSFGIVLAMRAVFLPMLGVLVACTTPVENAAPVPDPPAAPPPPDAATIACTAGDEAKRKELFSWLDREKHPLLVQLPESAYASLRDEWALP